MIDRRTLLSALAASALLPPGAALAGAPEERLYLSAFDDDNRSHHAAVFDGEGRILSTIPLPDRGHGGAFHPTRGEAVAFARRPGDFAVAFEARTGRVVATMRSPEGRHFYGHGAFTADGRLLYATENDYESGDGAIGIWDASDGYRRVGAFASNGIGPHELRFMPDGRTLAVANGGILTHPDSGRRKLNIPDIDPTLALIDSTDGTLVRETRLPRELHKLSIRHLAIGPGGEIGVALQYQGPKEDRPPLVFLWKDGEARLLDLPGDTLERMENYCGSAAMDPAGRVLGISAPRGDLVAFFAVEDGRFLESVKLDDGCGLAPGAGPADFVLSSGNGKRLLHTVGRQGDDRALPASAAHWDNHITPWRA